MVVMGAQLEEVGLAQLVLMQQGTELAVAVVVVPLFRMQTQPAGLAEMVLQA
jgi:hypothetical protein